jgi:hypothetical protein
MTCTRGSIIAPVTVRSGVFHAALRESAEGGRNLWRAGGEGEHRGGVEFQHPGCLHRATAGGQFGAQHDGHLAEHLARIPLADHPLDPVHLFGELNNALRDDEQGAFVALSSREFSGQEADVFDRARDEIEQVGVEFGEQRDGDELLGSDHEHIVKR